MISHSKNGLEEMKMTCSAREWIEVEIACFNDRADDPGFCTLVYAKNLTTTH